MGSNPILSVLYEEKIPKVCASPLWENRSLNFFHKKIQEYMNFFSFLKHTVELKVRGMYTFLAFLFTWGLFFYYAEDTLYLLMNPLVSLPNESFANIFSEKPEEIAKINQNFIFTKVTEAFFTELRFSFLLTLLWTIPVMLYQIWLFAKPGLYPKESEIFSSFCVASISLFFCGVFFGYTYILPIAWHFFTNFEMKDALFQLRLEAKISDFVDIASTWICLVGILFQYPIFLGFLLMMGWVSSKTLVERRKFSCLSAFILAACFSPPDILSQVMLAIPLLLFYELAIFLLLLQERLKIASEEGEEKKG